MQHPPPTSTTEEAQRWLWEGVDLDVRLVVNASAGINTSFVLLHILIGSWILNRPSPHRLLLQRSV